MVFRQAHLARIVLPRLHCEPRSARLRLNPFSRRDRSLTRGSIHPAGCKITGRCGRLRGPLHWKALGLEFAIEEKGEGDLRTALLTLHQKEYYIAFYARGATPSFGLRDWNLANCSSQRIRPVICITTKSVRIDPIVMARPVNPFS